MITNLANKQNNKLVVLIDGKHGTEHSFETVDRKEAFVQGLNWIVNKLSLSIDICLANNKFDAVKYAEDMKDSHVLLGQDHQDTEIETTEFTENQ